MSDKGRPKLFKNKEDLEQRIKDFENYVEEQKKPYTFSGLAYFLGIDRKTLYNYSKDEDFFPTIKDIRDKCQRYAEEQLYRDKGQVAGIIFALKNNMGWKDQVETHNTNIGLNLTIQIKDAGEGEK
ncbi:MAG: hypothetical protein JSW06_02995 [Thermoplasmatales archaeon]|nr:MAG: hypothetical protein JSW06_02995 [Thermoplasmatales archaeon]